MMDWRLSCSLACSLARHRFLVDIWPAILSLCPLAKMLAAKEH